MTKHEIKYFIGPAICYMGEGIISEQKLYSILDEHPLSLSGTSSAIYRFQYMEKNMLLKIFSRNWSNHTIDFFKWAYCDKSMNSETIYNLFLSLKKYTLTLTMYGLKTNEILEVWDITDPFQANIHERALAIILEELPFPTVRQKIFSIKGEKEQIQEIFVKNVELVLNAILRAKSLGHINQFIIDYGFDPKPRNFIFDNDWQYIDFFPILIPRIISDYKKNAPTKSFMKRYDTRYYMYDILMRYYRIFPDMLEKLSILMFTKIEHSLGICSGDYIKFISQYIKSYELKWGYKLPDNE